MTRWNRPVVLGYLYIILVENYWAWILLGLVPIGLAATGHLGWGWALFVVAVIWYIMSSNYKARKSNHLDQYIVYLLLNDSIREKHSKDVRRLIQSIDAPDAMALSHRVYRAIEKMADGLGAGDPKRPGS